MDTAVSTVGAPGGVAEAVPHDDEHAVKSKMVGMGSHHIRYGLTTHPKWRATYNWIHSRAMHPFTATGAHAHTFLTLKNTQRWRRTWRRR